MADVSPQLPPVRQSGSRMRVGVWVGHMALPMLAPWLLPTRPEIDLQWEHRPCQFWPTTWSG